MMIVMVQEKRLKIDKGMLEPQYMEAHARGKFSVQYRISRS